MTMLKSACMLGLVLIPGIVGCEVASENPVPAAPQRPLFARRPDTTVKGAVQVEAGLFLDARDLIDTPITTRVGIAENTEIYGTISPFFRPNTGNGYESSFGDTRIGTRVRFTEDDGQGGLMPSSALQIEAKIPTADERQVGTNEEIDLNISASIAKNFTEDLRIGVYGGVEILGDPTGGDPDYGQFLSIFGVHNIVDKLDILAELAGRVNGTQDIDEYFTTWGLAYEISPALVVDSAVIIGLSEDRNDVQFLGGLTVLLGQPFLY